MERIKEVGTRRGTGPNKMEEVIKKLRMQNPIRRPKTFYEEEEKEEEKSPKQQMFFLLKRLGLLMKRFLFVSKHMILFSPIIELNKIFRVLEVYIRLHGFISLVWMELYWMSKEDWFVYLEPREVIVIGRLSKSMGYTMPMLHAQRWFCKCFSYFGLSFLTSFLINSCLIVSGRIYLYRYLMIIRVWSHFGF